MKQSKQSWHQRMIFLPLIVIIQLTLCIPSCIVGRCCMAPMVPIIFCVEWGQYSPITWSAICGESLVCIRKSLELAAKYVTVLYKMHSSQSHEGINTGEIASLNPYPMELRKEESVDLLLANILILFYICESVSWCHIQRLIMWWCERFANINITVYILKMIKYYK